MVIKKHEKTLTHFCAVAGAKGARKHYLHDLYEVGNATDDEKSQKIKCYLAFK